MVKTDFNTETGILQSKFEGEVSLKEVIDYIKYTRDNLFFPRKLKILTDAIDAHFNFSPDDLEKVVEANNISINRYDYIIDAILISGPKATALSLLYQKFSKKDNYKFNIFSTRKAASEWLEKMDFQSA